MGRNSGSRNSCEPAVKAVVPFHKHSSCCKTRHSSRLCQGSLILRFAGIAAPVEGFDEKRSYRICKTLERSINSMLTRESKCDSTSVENTEGVGGCE